VVGFRVVKATRRRRAVGAYYHYPGGDAVRLLRAINAHQAHGRVGSEVLASAVARDAALEPGTERYEEAVWRLLAGRALVVDGGCPPGEAAGAPLGREPYRLAPAAVRILERA
jgi:hypothetical protein